MNTILAGHFAVVAGSTGGIGLAIAQRLLEWGVEGLMLHGRDAVAGEAAANGLRARFPHRKLVVAYSDLTTVEGCERLFDAARAVTPSLDIFIHAAGGRSGLDIFSKIDPSRLQGIVEGHFLGFVRCCHHAIPMLRAGTGSIVAIGSDAGKVATPGEAMVGAMKAATFMFIRTLAMELKRDRIRANGVSPSLVAGSPAYDRMMAKDFSRRVFQKAEARARLGLPVPDDVANLAVFLVSPLAQKITGQIVSINGGISAA